jgi:hypothetical protein
MKHTTFVIVTAMIAISCASEDPNIVNPPPGNANVIVRLFNMVADAKHRQLLLEAGYQTSLVPPGSFSATVQAPSDSSFLEILADGATEYRTASRQRFTRSSVYDVYAVGGPDAPSQFDTIMVSNANVSLTTQPVAQLRIVNAFPDTNRTYDVRIGCPNGTPLTTTPLRFRQATLYNELPPGQNVVSISELTGTSSRMIGTFQCLLEERTPYTILLHPVAGKSEVQLMLYSEADFTTGAARTLAPVLVRDADVRVLNLSTNDVTVTVRRTGQVLATDLGNRQLSAYGSVPTCESSEADVFTAVFSDGRSAVDSTSLTVRGSYTVVTTEDASGDGRLFVIPPHEPVFGRSGKAVIRVASAFTLTSTRVSVGARTDAQSDNGFSSGRTLTSEIRFGELSEASVLEPGQIPVTITSAKTPTTALAHRLVDLEGDHDYILLIADDGKGGMSVFAFDEDDRPGAIIESDVAASATFVNGSSVTDHINVSFGTVVNNGRVFYRNSFSTIVPYGPLTIAAAGTQATLTTATGNRTLAIYTVNAGSGKIIDITTPPLTTTPGFSQRRFINASADLPLISVAYDTNYKANPDVAHFDKNIAFGTSSRIETMYVYDSQTLERLYSLPNDIGPLGNSYSLIFVGSRQKGYEVIVLQEF